MNKQVEIKAILNTIEGMKYSSVQSIDLLLAYGFQLTSWIAFTAEAMAEAKEALHKSRAVKYRVVIDEMVKQGKSASPSIINQYVSDKCYQEHGYYELCERANRAATHSMDLVRTAISALKQEMLQKSF